MGTIKPHAYSYAIQGVQVKPLSGDGREVSILYNGLLARSGAGQVYLHFGFGENGNWREIKIQPMERSNGGWEKTVKLEGDSQLNFCFKDGVENWDNNSGNNWAYRISG